LLPILQKIQGSHGHEWLIQIAIIWGEQVLEFWFRKHQWDLWELTSQQVADGGDCVGSARTSCFGTLVVLMIK
jgi:hypothetical protein